MAVAAKPAQGQPGPDYTGAASALRYISALFVFTGIATFIFLIALIFGNESFSNEINPPTPTTEFDLEAFLADVDPGQRAELVERSIVVLESTNLVLNLESALADVPVEQRAARLDDVLTLIRLENAGVSPDNMADEMGIDLSRLVVDRVREVNLGRAILVFLTEFGIVFPVIIIAIGIYTIRMGLRLYQRSLETSLWARQLLIWLLVAGVFGLFSGFINAGNVSGGIIVAVIPWIFLIAVVTFVMRWLMGNESIFLGQETLSSRSSRTAWNLLIPTIAVLIVVALQPLEQTFIASLTNDEFASSTETEFVGLDNYTRLLGLRFDTVPCERDAGSCAKDENGNTVYPRARRYLIDNVENYDSWGYRPLNEFTLLGTRYVVSARDSDFMNSIYDTMVFTLGSVVLELLFGLFIAMVVNSKFTGRGLMRTAMLIPWAVPTVVSARLWELMLKDNESGVVNRVLIQAGIIDQSQSWLTNAQLQIPAMIAVDVWKTTPFMALLLLAGLQVIPRDIYEAADVDGASKVRQFFNITIPLLRPAIAVALVFRTLDAVRVFDLFQVLLGGNRFSMATYNYEMLVTNNEFGYASAIGVVIFILILLFTIAYVRILGVED